MVVPWPGRELIFILPSSSFTRLRMLCSPMPFCRVLIFLLLFLGTVKPTPLSWAFKWTYLGLMCRLKMASLACACFKILFCSFFPSTNTLQVRLQHKICGLTLCTLCKLLQILIIARYLSNALESWPAHALLRHALLSRALYSKAGIVLVLVYIYHCSECNNK